MKPIAPFFTTIALFITVTLLSYGCSKSDDNNSTTKKIEGLYIGRVQNSQEGTEYNLVIKPGATLTFYGYARGVHIFGVGTWTRNGNDFAARVETIYGPPDFIGIQQAITAKFNPSTGELTECKYVNIVGSADVGTITVSKVQ
jgi:hypothetical protein